MIQFDLIIIFHSVQSSDFRPQWTEETNSIKKRGGFRKNYTTFLSGNYINNENITFFTFLSRVQTCNIFTMHMA